MWWGLGCRGASTWLRCSFNALLVLCPAAPPGGVECCHWPGRGSAGGGGGDVAGGCWGSNLAGGQKVPFGLFRCTVRLSAGWPAVLEVPGGGGGGYA